MYSAFAPVYDALMEDFPYDDLLHRYSSVAPLRGRILEMGCGSGRLTQRLLRQSTQYWAVDVSEEMLALAARRLGSPSGLHLFLDTGEAFPSALDIVIAAVDVVNYMEEEEVASFFSRSYDALSQGGSLVFDISTQEKLKEELGDNVFVYEKEEFTLIWQNQYSEKERGVFFFLTMFFREGEYYRKETERQFQRAWSVRELEKALKKAGFHTVKNEGTFDRLIFAAKK